MRHLATVALVCVLPPLALTAQIRRDPLIISMPYEVVNPPESPVELAVGALNPGARVIETLIVRLRARRPSTPLDNVVIRLAAGMFDEGMVTYRMRTTTSVAPPPGAAPSDDPLTWTVAIFERMREDPSPAFGHVGRQTKFVIMIEQVRDPSGRVIYENADCREQLWKVLGGG
jgi:hypothetical protein